MVDVNDSEIDCSRVSVKFLLCDRNSLNKVPSYYRYYFFYDHCTIAIPTLENKSNYLGIRKPENIVGYSLTIKFIFAYLFKPQEVYEIVNLNNINNPIQFIIETFTKEGDAILASEKFKNEIIKNKRLFNFSKKSYGGKT